MQARKRKHGCGLTVIILLETIEPPPYPFRFVYSKADRVRVTHRGLRRGLARDLGKWLTEIVTFKPALDSLE